MSVVVITRTDGTSINIASSLVSRVNLNRHYRGEHLTECRLGSECPQGPENCKHIHLPESFSLVQTINEHQQHYDVYIPISSNTISRANENDDDSVTNTADFCKTRLQQDRNSSSRPTTSLLPKQLEAKTDSHHHHHKTSFLFDSNPQKIALCQRPPVAVTRTDGTVIKVVPSILSRKNLDRHYVGEILVECPDRRGDCLLGPGHCKYVHLPEARYGSANTRTTERAATQIKLDELRKNSRIVGGEDTLRKNCREAIAVPSSLHETVGWSPVVAASLFVSSSPIVGSSPFVSWSLFSGWSPVIDSSLCVGWSWNDDGENGF